MTTPSSKVSRQWVQDLLRVAHLPPEIEQRVLALPYPADLDDVVRELQSSGITKDELENRMGGSP